MINYISPQALGIHPVRTTLPTLRRDSEDFKALVTSIATAGLLEPLKVKGGLVVDGEARLTGCIQLGYEQVPCIEIADGELYSVVFHSLVGRRHYTKGALAYLSSPLFNQMLEESKARQLANLKRGPENPSSTLSRLSGTAEDAADRLGIGRALFFQARNIHGHFKKHPEMQEHFEPKILSGELGLGAVLQGIAGWESTKGKSRPETEQLLLWDQKIKGLVDPRKFAGWEKTPEEVRRHVREELIRGIRAHWPAELANAVFDELTTD